MKYDAVARFWFIDQAELLSFLAKNKLTGVTLDRLVNDDIRDFNTSFNWSVAEGKTPEDLFRKITEALKDCGAGIQSAILTGVDVVLDIAVEILPTESFPVFSFTIPSTPLAEVASLGIDIKFSIWAVDDDEEDDENQESDSNNSGR